MEMKRNIRRFALLTPYSLDTIFETPILTTISKIPTLLARAIGSIVGVTLLIWFALFVVFLLVDSSMPLALLEWLASSPSHTHLTILCLAALTVFSRIDPLCQAWLLSVLLMNLSVALSPMP